MALLGYANLSIAKIAFVLDFFILEGFYAAYNLWHFTSFLRWEPKSQDQSRMQYIVVTIKRTCKSWVFGREIVFLLHPTMNSATDINT